MDHISMEHERQRPDADSLQPEDAPSGLPLWVAALGVTLGMQTISAFLIRMLPVVAPVITEAAGVDPEKVGMLAGAGSAGTMCFLVFGSLLITRLGPVRSLQVGGLAAAAATVAALTANWWLVIFAAFLIGVGYGPSPPAGSEILTRSTPKKHRALIMSVKQSGVPLGGVIAGLWLPAVTLWAGWRMALVSAAVMSVLSAIAVQPWRGRLDADRDRARQLSFRAVFSRENLTAPFSVLHEIPGLTAMTTVGVCFACIQGCVLAFFVTQLTTELHFSLAAAGAAFAAMQVVGTLARVLMGWLADRLGGRRTLLLLAFCSSAMVALLSRIGPDWPPFLVTLTALVVGLFCISWNGVHLAEVARTAPAGRIGDATAGVTFFTFAAYAVAPLVFTFCVSRLESYGTCFLGLAVVALFPIPALIRLIRKENNVKCRM